jgi:hypothetical protein
MCALAATEHLVIAKRYLQNFHGLELVIRFEVDACLPDISPCAASAAANSGPEMPSTVSGVSLRKGGPGYFIPQESLVELKSKSARFIHEFEWSNATPQLFLSATPNLYIGLHTRGKFVDIHKHALASGALGPARRETAERCERLARALKDVRKFVVERAAEGPFSLVCRDGVLKIYRRLDDASGDLPADLAARFFAL